MLVRSLTYLVIGLVAIASANPRPTCCAADRCFDAASFPPEYTPEASLFCEKYIHKTPGTVTRTSTSTIIETLRPSAPTRTQVHVTTTPTVTVTPSVTTKTPPATTIVKTLTGNPTVTLGTTCVVTSTTSVLTFVNYLTEKHQAKRDILMPTAIPALMIAGCSNDIPHQISSACSCFLTSTTTTTTTTTTKTVTAGTSSVSDSTKVVTASTITVTASGSTVTALPPQVTATTDQRSTVTSIACTSTSTIYSYLGQNSCGVDSPTTVERKGVISCTSAAPPGETNARLRLEGSDSDGTIFEDCIVSGPSDVTTPSGGTHRCDGTNGGSNPNPGNTPTTSLQSAAILDGFGFDGTYSSQFQDFFITSIGRSTQTSTQFFGLLINEVFTPVGGCQIELFNGQRGLFAFDAFNKNTFLTIAPDYMVVDSSTVSVQVTVKGNDGSGDERLYAGATIAGGTTSDANGISTILVPQVPGCYQFKATAGNAIRSNAFYLTVLGPTKSKL